jgi:hypothetical protein
MALFYKKENIKAIFDLSIFNVSARGNNSFEHPSASFC